MFSDGCVQFPDLISSAEVRALRQWMDSLGEPDEKYEFKNWCFNKHIAMDIHDDPIGWTISIAARCTRLRLELIFASQVICTGGSLWVTGKGRAMGMHADWLTLSIPEEFLCDPRVRLPVYNTTLHIYLDDQVPEIGPTL